MNFHFFDNFCSSMDSVILWVSGAFSLSHSQNLLSCFYSFNFFNSFFCCCLNEWCLKLDSFRIQNKKQKTKVKIQNRFYYDDDDDDEYDQQQQQQQQQQQSFRLILFVVVVFNDDHGSWIIDQHFIYTHQERERERERTTFINCSWPELRQTQWIHI